MRFLSLGVQIDIVLKFLEGKLCRLKGIHFPVRTNPPCHRERMRANVRTDVQHDSTRLQQTTDDRYGVRFEYAEI